MNASNTYIARIENAPAVKLPRGMLGAVAHGRLLAAMVELHRFEQGAQKDRAHVAQLLGSLELAEATLAERDLEIKRLNQKLFNAHSARSNIAKKLRNTTTSEQVEFPKGTGRIAQLRYWCDRYPGTKLRSDGMFVSAEGEELGQVQS